MNIRKPAVAGRFYPGDGDELTEVLDDLVRIEDNKIRRELLGREIIGGVVPHAGYIYSGGIAAHFFELLKNSPQNYDTAVIIAPNHTGYGADIGCDTSDEWETPLGNIEVDHEFLEKTGLEFSGDANKYEHSAEVMAPMLKHFINYNIKIAPIIMKRQNLKNSIKIAEALIKACRVTGRKIVIIASSDFSHYVEPDYGKKVDAEAVAEILQKNSVGFIEKIAEKDISICGYGPIMVLIEYSKMLPFDAEFEVLRIGSSGEVVPSETVVDYCSIALLKR